jgi:MFS transporter, PPP family, 3-phenylpropionic acid transporter
VSDRRLGAIYAAQGMAFGLLMPFTVPLLVERGLGAAEIGLVLGVAGVASLVAYPVWGAIADGFLGRRHTIVLTGFTAAAGGVWILLAGSDRTTLTLALSTALVGALAWGPLIDALALGELGERSEDYGRIRVWASVGWTISAISAGLVWTAVGAAAVLLAFVLGSLLVALVVLLPPAASTAEGHPGMASAEARPPERPSLRSWLPLFLTPVLLGFLLGLLVTSIGEHASWRYISLRILDQGGGVFLVGLAAALPAIVEIPVFASSRRLAGSLGLRLLFVVGALLAAGLTLLVAVAPEPWMVTALRTLEGSAYALRYMAMVMIVGVLLPRHLHAMGQSVAWFVYAGVAPIAADIAGGLIYEVLGAAVLFVTAAAALVVGGAIVFVALSGPTFRARAQRPGRAIEPVAAAAPPPPPA